MDKARAGSDQDVPRRAWWIGGLIFAIFVAAYVGFRLPSLYSMTLYNIGIADGA